MQKLVVILTALISTSLWATPEKIEIFFLSEQKASTLLEWIDKNEAPAYYAKTSQREPFECIPMGDQGCFHPQLGFVDEKPPILEVKEKEEAPQGYELKTFNSLDVDLVECRDGEHFDIFCGQKTSEKKSQAPEFEVWFDISTSLRKTDYSKDMEFCHRRSFAQDLISQCDQKPRIGVYNTALKSVSDLSSICLYRGTNDKKRLFRWIRASKAKHLIIVTDAEEYTPELRDFLSVENAVLHGMDSESLYSDDLVDKVASLTKSCKK